MGFLFLSWYNVTDGKKTGKKTRNKTYVRQEKRRGQVRDGFGT